MESLKRKVASLLGVTKVDGEMTARLSPEWRGSFSGDLIADEQGVIDLGEYFENRM